MKIDDDVMQAAVVAFNTATDAIPDQECYAIIARAIQSERDRNRAEIERLKALQAHGCECGTDEACRFHAEKDATIDRLTRERDEARAEIERISLRIEGFEAVVDDHVSYIERLKSDITRLTRERDEARAEIERLTSLNTILMGDDEDKPRYTTKRLKLEIAKATEAIARERDDYFEQLALRSDSQLSKDLQRVMAINNDLVRERDEARVALRNAEEWYWPENDTSSDACANSPAEAVGEYLDWGQIAQYAAGGVIRTGWYGKLPPADDADSDDEFEVDEPTEEAARAKIDAEIARRAALKGGAE